MIKTQYVNTSKKISRKHKVTQCLDKMENNNDDIEQDIRACHTYIEKAFYFVSR